MPKRKDPTQEAIDVLTTRLAETREEAMVAAGYDAFGLREVASFHGTIGGKNNVYVDSIREAFLSPEEFVSEWKQGLLAKAQERDTVDIAGYGGRFQNSAAHAILRMLQNPVLDQYISLFLERNFYRQYLARTRVKPEDALWEIWFGPKHQEYGLFITPRFKNGDWENDVSEIRRVEFDYWTVGHVLASGFLIPHKPKQYVTRSLDDLFQVYDHVFIRSAGSIYSSAIAERYEAYVRAQEEPEKVPFLIPEFRYEGDPNGPHKHRLDFTILSAGENLRVGIELSPWSTHGRIKGKRKLQAEGGEGAIEKARIEKWEEDTKKRNAYFQKFGITTLTFTDSQLADMDEAFAQIEAYLSPANERRQPAPQVKKAISNYRFDS